MTQRVPLADVEDLFSRPARAAVAWAGPAGPECVPVVAERDGGIRIGLYPGAIRATGARVVLVVDDGASGSSCALPCGGGQWRPTTLTQAGPATMASFCSGSSLSDSPLGTTGDCERTRPDETERPSGRPLCRALPGHAARHGSARGRPSLTPIWFVKLDGRLISSTAATTVAARNVAAEPRVTVFLDGETARQSEFVLRLRGTAVIHRGLPSLGVLARFGVKYYLAPRGLRSELSHTGRWRLRTRYYAQSDAVWLTVEPTAAELIPVPSRHATEPGRSMPTR